MMPTVSVCIPVYNGEKTITEAIESVLAQTTTDFELIVLDNASSDRTPEIVARFTDPRIRLVRNESNIGAGANFNRALDVATAPYVKILCADDVLHPNCLERQVEIMEREPSVAMVTSRRTIIDEAGRPGLTRGLRREGRYVAPSIFKTVVRSGSNPIGEPSAVLLRRSSADAAGRFNPDALYVIDLEYWLRVLDHGDLWAILEPLVDFRVSGTSWSIGLTSQQVSCYWNLLHDMRRSGHHGISTIDAIVGRAAAAFNAVGRRLYYTATVPRVRGAAGE